MVTRRSECSPPKPKLMEFNPLLQPSPSAILCSMVFHSLLRQQPALDHQMETSSQFLPYASQATTTTECAAGRSPSGLPARPPPSQAGYGGPQNFVPPGFNQMPAYPQPGGGPPPGFAPPPGFGAPQAGLIPSAPPVLPGGFSGYGIRK